MIKVTSQQRARYAATRREGWAALGMNFAGAGWRYNLGARPRSDWDFVSKLHDLAYVANELKWSERSTREPILRSRFERADYIFRQMSIGLDRRLYEDVYNWIAEMAFKGKDKSRFSNNDRYLNILHLSGLTISNGYFMIPWDEIPGSERSRIKARCRLDAEQEFDASGNTLQLLNKKYGVDIERGKIDKNKSRSARETDGQRRRRIIKEIACFNQYNVKASVDSTRWKTWAKDRFGPAWNKVLSI